MGMAIIAPRYTVADLDEFPNDGNRYELLDGQLLVTPSPVNAHQIIANRLQVALSLAVVSLPGAHVVGPGVLRVPPGLHLEPDILVYPARFKPGTPWDKITGHWLAVEILSPSSRVYDREFKRGAYLALGVQEVWIVDIEAKFVDVCRDGFTEIVHDRVRWPVPETDRVISIDLSMIFDGLP